MAGSSKSKAAEDFPPLPAKPDIGQTSPSPAAPSTQDVLLQQILTMQKQQSELLEMQRQQAEDHRLLRADHQRLAQINVELEAKVAAKSGTSDPESAATSAEKLLERRKKLDYVPAASLEQEPGSSQRGGQEALRAKLQFVEDRVYQAADGVVADEVLQQWLNDFDKNRGRAVLNIASKNAANAETRVPKDPRDRERWKERKNKEKDAAGETTEGSMARGGRQFRGDAMDYSRGEVEVEARASTSVRPRGVTEGCDAAAAGVAGRGEGEAARERGLDESDEKISRFARFFGAETGYEQVETGGGLPMAEPVVCKKSCEDGDVEETKETGETGRLAAEDRREIKRLRDGSAVRQRWSVRRRTGGAGGDANRHSGMRVLPYMDDFLVLVDSQREGFLRREKVQLVLHRLGLRRNEKKGHWEPTQVVEHLGLEVDLKLGQFRVTERRVHKIHAKAKEILCDAARNRRWIPARRLASFTGLCQSVYLAVPAARLYLRELYFVLAEKRSWGAKVKISRSARGDLEWWSRLPVMSRWNGRKIWRSPTRAKVHTDSSMTAWGGVLNLKFPARGFWPDEMRCWHITHLELEAVYKTVQAFLQELEGKVVRLYCDNQAVVAMLSHFTSRNPDLMRRMRRLWLLLDLHDIELQARYIRSEANVWADNLSRCEDLDDWRLNRDWFVWANKQWGPYTVDRFASEISAQLPRYYAAWKDPKCEGVDSLTYDWRGENNWVNPPWALLDEVAHKLREEGAAATVVAPYWPGQSWFRELEALATEVVFWEDDDCFYPGVVKEFNEDGKAHVLYDDGDEETLDLSEENFKIIHSTDETTDADGENTERSSGGNYEEYKRGGAVQNFLTRSLCERWRSELGPSRLTELAVSMQRKALLDTTKDNYGPKARRFILFCERDQRPWLPASEATVLLYIASLLEDGNIQSASLQPYLSAINNYHEDLGHPGPAKGRSVTRAGKGMATIQAELAEQEENIETQRTWLPAAHVRRVHEAALKFNPRSPEELKLLRALTYVVVAFVTFGRPDTGTSLSRQHVHCGDEEFSVVLLKEKGRRHHRVKRRLTIPWKGVTLLKELIEHWEFYRDTAWSIFAKTQPDSYWLLPEDPKNFKASVANDWIGLALSELDCRPPEGGHFSAHSTRKGATTCARAVGVTMEKVCFLGGWSQFSSAVQHYIDPTALRDTDMDYYFAWLTWSQ
ncbi:hypothetical protein CYMTET_9388 [Cymbomonas tetramitiformis]|uniref:Core-binding (CB) domain-containing protein n=1 Tax=Cymbomonas tetramitiformis TaxID=36881 RepID=A0AAE0GRB9_9CHLO|nr:hypothetical protein CYMTET_9388 [Cymbomonas tetramitiformis]